MTRGVPTKYAAALLLGVGCTLLFAASALGATATVGLGTAASFSVLGGSTVTNTAPRRCSATSASAPDRR